MKKRNALSLPSEGMHGRVLASVMWSWRGASVSDVVVVLRGASVSDVVMEGC